MDIASQAARAPGGGTAGIEVALEERTVPLGSIRVLVPAEPATAAARARQPLPTKALVDLDGQQCRVSGRFWKSIFARYRFGASTFRYFAPEEVFKRLCEVSRNDTVRVVVERTPNAMPVALAASRPQDRLLSIDDVRELATGHGATAIGYSEGVVDCTFTPRSGEKALAIGTDDFANRFRLDVPVDGLGNARIHVALLRLLCTNGLVGHHRAFASDVPASANPRHTLRRAIECFDHSDGFAAIRERFLSAQTSWASVREAHGLSKQLVKMTAIDPGTKRRALDDFDALTGRVREFYGLTNVDTLAVRRQRLLPVKCKVYDLLNFAGEVATHVARAEDARPLQSWIGGTLADEFDLEGTAAQVSEFTDLFLRAAGESTTGDGRSA
jgi:hypothetical protein